MNNTRLPYILGGVALAVLIIAAFTWGPDWFGNGDEPPPVVETAPVPEPVEPAPAVATAPTPREPEPELPPLDASDTFVLDRIQAFNLPSLWLDRGDLMRRAAVVVDNAARGDYPKRQLGFLAPSGQFKVQERNGNLYIDPASYDRYDSYLDMVEKIDPARMADTLRLLEPLLADGLAELGNKQPAASQLDAAIANILSLPELPDEIEVVQPKVLYEYADPELESLSPLQKQVLRMGPENVRRLKAYLQKLRVALGTAAA